MATSDNKNIAISGMQLAASVVAILLTMAGSAVALMDRWATMSDRVLTQEVRSAAKWESQESRDRRQDDDLLRSTQSINSKIDNLSQQLQFLTDSLIEKGVARG